MLQSGDLDCSPSQMNLSSLTAFIAGSFIGVTAVIFVSLVSRPSPTIANRDAPLQNSTSRQILWKNLAAISQRLKKAPEPIWEDERTELGFESLDFPIEAERVSIGDGYYVYFIRPLHGFTRPKSIVWREPEDSIFWTTPKREIGPEVDYLKYVPGREAKDPVFPRMLANPIKRSPFGSPRTDTWRSSEPVKK